MSPWVYGGYLLVLLAVPVLTLSAVFPHVNTAVTLGVSLPSLAKDGLVLPATASRC